MNTQASTRENINRLIAFRQKVYARVFAARRDALFDMLDALLSAGSVSSFAMLSQGERFRRQWPSLYAAVEDGQVNQEALRALLASQLPRQGICLFRWTVLAGHAHTGGCWVASNALHRRVNRRSLGCPSHWGARLPADLRGGRHKHLADARKPGIPDL